MFPFIRPYIGDGSDYTGGSFQVDFLAGSTTASLSVPILDDNLFEGPEWFGGFLTIEPGSSAELGGVTVGPDQTANVTISDDEGAIFVQFDSTTYSFNEDVGQGKLTLVADQPAPEGGYSVEVSFEDGTAGCKSQLNTLYKM